MVSPNLSKIGRNIFKRPRLYLTIVALYLLVSTVFVICATIMVFIAFGKAAAASPDDANFLGTALFVFIIFPWVAIISILSVIAAVRLLISRGEEGVIFSLVALVFMGITFPLSVVGFVGSILNLSPDENLLAAVVDWSGISLAITMFPTWVLGWKRMNKASA